MKRNVFLRVLGISSLYVGVFIALVLIQFVKHTSFTHLVGAMVISGNYRDLGELKKTGKNVSFFLEKGIKVMFGGMEFLLFPDQGFEGFDGQGKLQELTATSMMIGEDEVRIGLARGGELRFKNVYTSGVPSLSIQGTLPEGYTEVRVPFRVLRSAHLVAGERGSMLVKQGEKTYLFTRGTVDYGKRFLSLRRNEPLAMYGVLPERKGFNPQEFMVAEGVDRNLFNSLRSQVMNSWMAQWERLMGENPDEDTVMAYITESVQRGTYRQAVATVSPLFLEGSGRTYRSSVFFGRLDMGLRSLSAYERDYLSRISRLANEKSPDLLTEERIVYQLALRGNRALLSDVATIAKSIDPPSINLPLACGILEGWVDWKNSIDTDTSHVLFEAGGENPFERLLDQARFVVAGALVKVGSDMVFAEKDQKIDILFNCRLGKALVTYGNLSGFREWTDIGYSILASILKNSRGSSFLFAVYHLPASGETVLSEGEGQLRYARLYPYVGQELYYPRRVALLGLPWGGVWTWTGGGDLRVTYEGNVLSIAVNFPEGETHYMFIRGIKPFTKLQLYNIDYRTDPRFERYDSSGWAYSESEQTLLLKMKHRANTEYIRIYY
ncbi:MAG: hypothetical protein N2Z76_02025 [Treponemataceae bacterium]|nr:hypothetical protein [Treponemataceae bacterium]